MWVSNGFQTFRQACTQTHTCIHFCIHKCMQASRHDKRILNHIDTLSNLCLTYGYEASLHSRRIVSSDEVYLSVVFFSIIWEPAAWQCAWFFASTDAKDLSVWFGHSSFFFLRGWNPSRFAAETPLKTFQTVALSCATTSWRSWYLCSLQRSEVDFPMSVLMKIISRLNEYQADRYSVAANRQYGKCLGASTARIAHKLKQISLIPPPFLHRME